VFRVSFVCSFALVYVFRGSLWVLCSFDLLLMVSSPFASPRGVGSLWVFATWSVLCLQHLPERSCDLCISVMSSRCPCLWGQRFFHVEIGLCVSSLSKWLWFAFVRLLIIWMSLSAFASCWRIKLVCTYDPQAYEPTPSSPRGFPRFLSIRGARGLHAFDLTLLTNLSKP
jgi:hypothetical protein